MAAIDYAGIPESTRQSLLAAMYRMALEIRQDPELNEEFERRLAEKRAARKAAK